MTREAKILIVDDEYGKVKFIVNLMKDIIFANFDHVTCSREAVKKVRDNIYDLIIIDLQIPEALGEDVNPYGGRDLLEYIEDNDDLNRPTHILGITAHKDSYDECSASFSKRGWSLVCGVENKDIIKSIILAKARHAVDPPTNYDVAILTALEHIELQAVLDLPCEWIPVKTPTDCNIYYSGSIVSEKGKVISLIATSCHHMGIAQASAVGMKMCLTYRPSYIFMTGIAAGIEGKVKLGDILIADPCWDWGNGKQTIRNGKPVFLSAPRQLPMNPLLRAKLKKISTSRKFLDEIYAAWHGPDKPANTLNAHIGPVATGASVLEDPSVVEMIQSQHRETIGIEMEAYGLALASIMSSIDPPKVIIIKSVCDFADPQKNNELQTYAAYTSAQFAMKFIVNELYDE